MKRYVIAVVLFALGTSFGVTIFILLRKNSSPSSVVTPVTHVFDKVTESLRTLDKYSIESLTKKGGIASTISFDEAVATESAYTAWKFSFRTQNKKATGLAHIPVSVDEDPSQVYPVVVQLRGYVDQEIYEPGIGTVRSAQVYASKGYISLAPDFLGYGKSDFPSEDIFEERFQRYTTTIDLIASLSSLPQADTDKVALWGHSNGGHIALIILEITGESYPTTLWAPVTKPFPYSILYFTDEFEDGGKLLRKRLATFEKTYDTDSYSLTQYLDEIEAPIILHQGTADDAVPYRWNREFSIELEELEKVITYHEYSGADHNMGGAWDTVISRDISFFSKHLED